MTREVREPGNTDAAQRHKQYRIALESAMGVPFVAGNEITLLQNGDEIFPAMLDAIEQCRDSLEFTTYVFWKGQVADAFSEAFQRAAKRGVRVRLLFDAVGCKPISDVHLKNLENSGAEIRWFRPLATYRVWRLDKRTHRKIMICDDEVGFTGGVGIAQQWSGDARNSEEWRDSQVRIAGPACVGLAAAFRENWNEAGEWSLDIPTTEPSRLSGNVPMQIIRASGQVESSDMATLMRSLLSIAQSSIYIVTAYFAPDDTFVRLAKDAIRRGVKVRLLLPGSQTDSRLSQLAGHCSIEELVLQGAEVWQYEKTLLHAKLVVVDECVSCIGSANLNHRSMAKDDECNVLVLDDNLANSIINAFDRDCETAGMVVAKRWQNRSIYLRFKERLARLIIEQL